MSSKIIIIFLLFIQIFFGQNSSLEDEIYNAVDAFVAQLNNRSHRVSPSFQNAPQRHTNKLNLEEYTLRNSVHNFVYLSETTFYE